VRFAQSLEAGDARVRDRSGNWRLTRSGLRKLEEVVFGWHHPAARRAEIVDLAETALMAVYGFRAGVSYVVEEGEIRMIDPSNGRLMPDRKWEYGMQQMVEIKEGLPLSTENRTVGQITQQTYFRQYKVLSGLTGTGRECRGEFWAIYKLPTSFVAPFAPSRLRDFGFRRFRTAAEKWQEVATRALEVAESRAVLIGLNDVTEAQDLSREFARRGRPVTVLDALSEEREAEIVARGGERGRITIATHLAGRGTDISLAPEVRDAGGLHVIIASVMASGRLERQLYGRAGRQGDPGSFERMISFEDRGIEEGAFSIWRRCVTWMLRRGFFPAFSLAQIQAERDRRARSLRRRTLLREQDLMRRIGYR
jgi:preprotein translocase subunit SecA